MVNLKLNLFQQAYFNKVEEWELKLDSWCYPSDVSEGNSIYLFIYLFILYLKVDEHQIQLCTLKKQLCMKLQYIHAN